MMMKGEGGAINRSKGLTLIQEAAAGGCALAKTNVDAFVDGL